MTFKKITIGILSVVLILQCLVLYQVYLKPADIVFVDSNKLLENYEGMKTARQQFQQKAIVWQANMDTLKAELDREIQKYNKEKTSMTAKEQELSKKLISTKQQQFVEYQKNIQQQSQQEDVEMTEKVLAEVNTFIEDYGKKKGYTIILAATNAGNIVYAEKYLDITDKLQQELNSNYLGF